MCRREVLAAVAAAGGATAGYGTYRAIADGEERSKPVVRRPPRKVKRRNGDRDSWVDRYGD